MSKFFTAPLALLLASAIGTLGSDEMKLDIPGLPDSEAPKGFGSADPDLPRPLEGSRFAALGKKSPFTLASATEENADFAKDLVLAGYVRLSGKDFVIVANRTRPERLMVGTQESPGAQGMILVKLQQDPSGDPTKLQAQIRKNNDTATLKYESASPAPGEQAPLPPQVVSGQAGQTVPPGTPAPGQPPVANPAGQPTPPAPAVIRRRQTPVPKLPFR